VTTFFRIQDIADILIMTFLIYQLYSWFRATRAMQVLLGLGVVIVIYFATRFLGLYMTSWILQELGTVLIVLIVVVFQAEIRQTLYRFSLMRHVFGSRPEQPVSRFQEVADTLFRLAGKKTGALVVFQRNESLADQMLNGVRLDAEVSSQLLETIFEDGTPLHDGAVIIRGDRIELASCHLPLSASAEIPQQYGTRHRAALGISERSDAVAVVVSEERGEVLLAVGGEWLPVVSPRNLAEQLEKLIAPERRPPHVTFRQRLFSNMVPKVALLVMVTAFWALITSRQGQITYVTAPVRLHGIPDDLVLIRSVPEEVDVQVKSYSTLTPLPTKLDIAADINLAGIREGQSSVRIRPSDVRLPSGMVVGSISPGILRVSAEKKARKSVPVTLSLHGALPRRLAGYRVVLSPATVEVEGPAGEVARLESVQTEAMHAARLNRGMVYRTHLLPLRNKVVILRDDPVTVWLVPQR
jgi:uncharacterized protein (TIGR00159 family)